MMHLITICVTKSLKPLYLARTYLFLPQNKKWETYLKYSSKSEQSHSKRLKHD